MTASVKPFNRGDDIWGRGPARLKKSKVYDAFHKLFWKQPRRNSAKTGRLDLKDVAGVELQQQQGR